nr:MAG TPA: hypothetical protein [Caudoviricetes sp.]
MDILIGQRFRVKDWYELISTPNTYAESLGRCLRHKEDPVAFDIRHEKYCGKILTVSAVTQRHHSWDDSLTRFMAEESEGILWVPWMVELIENGRRVDENLFLSCLLL